MPVETFNFLDSLVASNPVATEGLVSGDDHIRGVKSTLLATFPGVTQALTRTGNSLIVGDGVSGAPSISFASEATLGFYRDGAGSINVTGGRLHGTRSAGEIFAFGGATAPAGSIVCDGSQQLIASFPDLYAAIGTTWTTSPDGTHFNVPDLRDRFLRHRNGAGLAGGVGNKQNPVNLTHSHGVNGNTADANADHVHSFSGTTSTMSANATHGHTITGSLFGGTASTGAAGGANDVVAAHASLGVSTVNTDHTHTFSGTTSGFSSQHQHGISITSSASGDASEARPYSASVLYCIAY